MLHKEFDQFQIRATAPNMWQQVATYRKRVAKRAQHVAPKMLQSFCRGLIIFADGFTLCK